MLETRQLLKRLFQLRKELKRPNLNEAKRSQYKQEQEKVEAQFWQKLKDLGLKVAQAAGKHFLRYLNLQLLSEVCAFIRDLGS